MAVRMVVFQIIVLLGSMNAFVKAVGLVNSSKCSEATCGNVSIPYTFRIDTDCNMTNLYWINCSHSFSPPKPFLASINLEVLDISLDDGTLRVNYPMFWGCSNATRIKFDSYYSRSLVFSQSRNKFIAIGCNNFASLIDAESAILCGCMSVCDNKNREMNISNSCNGINCFQTTIPSVLQDFSVSLKSIDTESDRINPSCKYAFIVEQKWFETNLTNPFEVQNMSHVPVVLEWLIDPTLFPLVTGNRLSSEETSTYVCANRSSTLTCSCKRGFKGYPYLPHPERCAGKLLLTSVY
ncbi:wall-associated receptor kinase-like 10 [Quercus lobata]|uniref:Wall-associated receptor kinase galacturonan-binding domain-containing protein n=1 Tax=Quercus lobata TaxID=97700 RepID=A0A7N2LGQ7_QUELO|nr:wall-associated receptor kinase-like 10 [Quercus lobata]